MKRHRRRIALDIDSLAAGGDGVGRDAEGRVTFVPRAVPGDKLLVQLVDERKQFARASVVEVLQASEHRVEDRCGYFARGECGGCQWQHVAQELQRTAKEAIVDNALRRSLDRGLERKPLLEPCPPLGWRRRARLSYWARGPLVLGFFAPRSQKITDIEQCPQFEPALQRGFDLVREHLLPGLRDKGEIELLLAEDGRVHVSVHGPADPKAVQALAAEASIAGVVHGKKVHGQAEVMLEFGVAASSSRFAQASRSGNIALCEEVAAAVGELAGKRVLELYAGSGNFTRLLAEAAQVVAVEHSPPPASGLPADVGANTEWQEAEVLEACDALRAASASFDLVLLDPPRTGARDVLDAIVALGPERIVYVSCDVATLARDIEQLHEQGYTATCAQPINMMPQTSQVELVVVLER